MSDDWRRLQKLSSTAQGPSEEETEFCMLKNRLMDPNAFVDEIRERMALAKAGE